MVNENENATPPRIGQAVHYVSYGTPGGEYRSLCRAATVTEQSNERADSYEVGLAVLNPTGLFFDRQVRYSEEHLGGTWHWACVTAQQPEQPAVLEDGLNSLQDNQSDTIKRG